MKYNVDLKTIPSSINPRARGNEETGPHVGGDPEILYAKAFTPI